jgi:hypothetical protein
MSSVEGRQPLKSRLSRSPRIVASVAYYASPIMVKLMLGIPYLAVKDFAVFPCKMPVEPRSTIPGGQPYRPRRVAPPPPGRHGRGATLAGLILGVEGASRGERIGARSIPARRDRCPGCPAVPPCRAAPPGPGGPGGGPPRGRGAAPAGGPPISAAQLEAERGGLEYCEGPRRDSVQMVRRRRRLVLKLNPPALGAPEVQELTQLLDLAPGRLQYDLTVGGREPFGPGFPSGLRDTIALAPRSTLQTMLYLSQGVIVPPEHIARGLAPATIGPTRPDGPLHLGQRRAAPAAVGKPSNGVVAMIPPRGKGGRAPRDLFNSFWLFEFSRFFSKPLAPLGRDILAACAGADHCHDAGADRLGQTRPGVDDGRQAGGP